MASYTNRPKPSNGLASYWASRAKAALGLTDENMLFDMHIFGSRNLNGVSAITGTGTTGGAQWLRLNCVGADVTRLAMGLPGAAAIIQSAAAKKFYIAGRFRLTAATVESGTHGGIGVGAGNAAETLVVGSRGATSTANYVAWGNNGTSINSGVPYDTTRRTHEFYRNGTTGLYLIDKVLRGTGDVQATADANLVAVAAAAAAVNRSIEFSWFAVAVELE